MEPLIGLTVRPAPPGRAVIERLGHRPWRRPHMGRTSARFAPPSGIGAQPKVEDADGWISMRSVKPSKDPPASELAKEQLRVAMESLVRLAASRRVHQRQAVAADVNLSRQGYRLLQMVVETGPITPTELAARTGIDPAVVTRQTRQLEAEGLISRRRDDADGRSSTLDADRIRNSRSQAHEKSPRPTHGTCAGELERPRRCAAGTPDGATGPRSSCHPLSRTATQR